jgi:hypothetical protein
VAATPRSAVGILGRHIEVVMETCMARREDSLFLAVLAHVLHNVGHPVALLKSHLPRQDLAQTPMIAVPEHLQPSDVVVSKSAVSKCLAVGRGQNLVLTPAPEFERYFCLEPSDFARGPHGHRFVGFVEQCGIRRYNNFQYAAAEVYHNWIAYLETLLCNATSQDCFSAALHFIQLACANPLDDEARVEPLYIYADYGVPPDGDLAMESPRNVNFWLEIDKDTNRIVEMVY